MGFDSYTPYTTHDKSPYLEDLEINMMPEKVSTLCDIESEPMDMLPTTANVFKSMRVAADDAPASTPGQAWTHCCGTSPVAGSDSDNNRFLASQRLLEYGFRFFATQKVLNANQEYKKINIWGFLKQKKY